MDKPFADAIKQLFMDRFPDPASLGAALGCPGTQARYETALLLLRWLSHADDAAALRRQLCTTERDISLDTENEPSLQTLLLAGLTIQSVTDLGLTSDPGHKRLTFDKEVSAIIETASGHLERIEVGLLGGLGTLIWTSQRTLEAFSIPEPALLDWSTSSLSPGKVLTMALDSLEATGIETRAIVSYPVILSAIFRKAGLSDRAYMKTAGKVFPNKNSP